MPSADVDEKSDPFKWIALCITFFGIAAWVAGTAYEQGYWSLIGWNSPIERNSLQQTAFTGYVGPVFNWPAACLVVMGGSAYLLLLEVTSNWQAARRMRKADRSAAVVNRPAKKVVDNEIIRMSIVLCAGAAGFLLLVFVPSMFWIKTAHGEGQHTMRSHICAARILPKFASIVELGDGSKLRGTFLDRSGSMSVLVDRSKVYVVLISQQPVIIDATDVTHIKCPT